MAKFSDINWKNPGLFAAGVLFGTAGIKALSVRMQRNFTPTAPQAVLRAKECVMKTIPTIQENATDIYEAQEIPTRSARLLLKPSRISRGRDHH